MKYLILLPIFLLSQVLLAHPNETILPLQFDFGNPAPYGGPTVVVMIQDKAIPLLLDTGAKRAALHLSEYALKNIQVQFTGEEECFDALDGKHCEKIFIVPEVNLGVFTIKHVKGLLMSTLWGGNEEGFHENEASKNGVIGFELLSQFNFLLDYPHSRAVLVKRGNHLKEYNTKTWIPIPFTGHLNTRLYINGKLMNISWDTGAIPSIIKHGSKAILKPCPGDAPYSQQTSCLSVQTSSFATEKHNLLPNTWFKAIDLPAAAPFDGLMGSNFYSQHLVYFDFDQQFIFVSGVSEINRSL